MKHARGHGFTIIELIVVIVVIGVIAALTFVSYRSSQIQARDTKLQEAAVNAMDAVKLFAAQKGHFPVGGDGSSVDIGNSTECPDGSGGFFGGNSLCTVFDTLVASDYLPANFMISLPINTVYDKSVKYTSLMLVQVPDFTPSRAVMMVSQEAPSAKVTARFNAAMSDCNVNPTLILTFTQYGMRDAYCFEY